MILFFNNKHYEVSSVDTAEGNHAELTGDVETQW